MSFRALGEEVNRASYGPMRELRCRQGACAKRVDLHRLGAGMFLVYAADCAAGRGRLQTGARQGGRHNINHMRNRANLCLQMGKDVQYNVFVKRIFLKLIIQCAK